MQSPSWPFVLCCHCLRNLALHITHSFYYPVKTAIIKDLFPVALVIREGFSRLQSHPLALWAVACPGGRFLRRTFEKEIQQSGWLFHWLSHIAPCPVIEWLATSSWAGRKWGTGVSQWHVSTMLFSSPSFTLDIQTNGIYCTFCTLWWKATAGNSTSDMHIALKHPGLSLFFLHQCGRGRRLLLLSCPLRHFDVTLWNASGKQKQILDFLPRLKWGKWMLSYCLKSLDPTDFKIVAQTNLSPLQHTENISKENESSANQSS